MSQKFDYQFNITGNAISATSSITSGVVDMNNKVKEAVGVWGSLSGKIVVFNQLSQFVEGFARTVESTMKPGAELNASLADMAAISGETGAGLKLIEKYARESARTFGGSAAQSVEAYKLILGQLSPELAKQPKALKAMGDNVSILSKTMGGNATAAAEVLTTAMNQFGVSLDDPMKASETMAEMMNVMAAAGREGAAELPQIKLALEQAGMAAKAAGVSFVETNAAIQVLDKAGKKGAEGGVALRNVMTTLARGRFLPKEIQKELMAAGVDINHLTDKSISLTDRLRPLNKVMGDSALFSKLFGRENTNAAMALIQNIDEVGRYTEAIQGTNTAFEQAEIVMDSYNEKKARVQAQFDDFRISIFNTTGDFGIWMEVVASSLVPIAQLTPLIIGIGEGMKWVKSLNWAGMWGGVSRSIRIARTNLLYMIKDLKTGQIASLGFTNNILRATLAIGRFATVGLWNGIKALGSYVLSLVTGGTASVTFAGIASLSFAKFKLSAITACRAVGIAIKSIPIIGWIVAIGAALAGLFVYFWKTSTRFRAVMSGMGAYFIEIFKHMREVAFSFFSGLYDVIKGTFTQDRLTQAMGLAKMTRKYADAGTAAAIAYVKAYNGVFDKAKAKELEKSEEDAALEELLKLNDDGNPIVTNLTNIGGSADGADKIKNITVSIEQLVGKFEIHTTNLKEDVNKVKDMVAEALVGAVNDLNYAR